jgi:hypothetical protein
MARRYSAIIAATIAIGLMGMFASTAVALPTYGVCSGCHSLSSSVHVSAVVKSNNGATASYSVSVSGPNSGNGWAVFNGSTKLTYGTSASGTFSVATGKTYTVYGGNASGSQQLYNKVSISPAASATPGATSTPIPDTTPSTIVGKVWYSVHFNLHGKRYAGLKAVFTNSAGHKTNVSINRRGNGRFYAVPGVYRLSAGGNKRFHFKARTVSIGMEDAEGDD